MQYQYGNQMKKKTQKNSEYYAVVLTGMGDTEIGIIDRDTYYWILDGGLPLPKSLIEATKEDEDAFASLCEAAKNSGSSPDNDRALVIMGLGVEYFTSHEEFLKWVAKKGAPVSTFEGQIY